MRRVHRTLLERLSYLAIYACKDCQTEDNLPRNHTIHFGRTARCPKCGTYRIVRLKEPDHIDPMYTGFWTILERMVGGKLFHCRYCRIQFHDRRRTVAEIAAEERGEQTVVEQTPETPEAPAPAIAAPEAEAKPPAAPAAEPATSAAETQSAPPTAAQNGESKPADPAEPATPVIAVPQAQMVDAVGPTAAAENPAPTTEQQPELAALAGQPPGEQSRVSSKAGSNRNAGRNGRKSKAARVRSGAAESAEAESEQTAEAAVPGDDGSDA